MPNTIIKNIIFQSNGNGSGEEGRGDGGGEREGERRDGEVGRMEVPLPDQRRADSGQIVNFLSDRRNDFHRLPADR